MNGVPTNPKKKFVNTRFSEKMNFLKNNFIFKEKFQNNILGQLIKKKSPQNSLTNYSIWFLKKLSPIKRKCLSENNLDQKDKTSRTRSMNQIFQQTKVGDDFEKKDFEKKDFESDENGYGNVLGEENENNYKNDYDNGYGNVMGNFLDNHMQKLTEENGNNSEMNNEIKIENGNENGNGKEDEINITGNVVNLDVVNYRTSFSFDPDNQLFNNSFWNKPSNIPPLKMRTNSFKVLYELTKRSGRGCLKLYSDIMNYRINLPIGRTLLLKKELEDRGADFLDWIIDSKLSDCLYNFVINYKWKRYLDSGTYTSVHLFESKTNSYVVLKLQKKFIDYDNASTMNSAAKVHLQEIFLLKSLNNENIIKVIDSGIHRDRYWITMEYADLNNLAFNISEYQKLNRSVPELEIYKFIFDILKGLHFIHNSRIIHRDLKSDNILVFSDLNSPVKKKFKIGDFNLSRSISSFTPLNHSYCGTLNTMAPEIVSREPYNHKIDIWSFMCILIELVIMQKINPISLDTERLNQKLLNSSNPHFKVMIHFMHKKDPELRPDTREIIEFIKATSY